MDDGYDKKKKKGLAVVSAFADYGRGVFFMLLGVFFFVRDQFKFEFNLRFPPDILDKILGAVCFAYGVWRIYRAAKKKA